MVTVDDSVQFAAAKAYLDSVCSNPYDVHGDGSVWVRCNSRISSKCASCSKLFQGDWAAICRSGLFDADGQALTGYSWAFITLTGGSYGSVHRAPHRLSDQLEKCACGATHEFGAAVAGEPINPANYDYSGSLLFNQVMPKLWNNTVTRWRRMFGKDFQYFAVTEAQRRGVMHKHVLVRYPRGSICPRALLAVAAEAYLVAWTGEIVKWGKQSDAEFIDAVHNPELAAKKANYLVKMTSYVLKQVNHATGKVSRASDRLLLYAAYEYKCSAECDRADGGSVCSHPIHTDLVGSERVLSQSKRWSSTGATRTSIREARQVYANAMREASGAAAQDDPEGMTGADLYASKLIRKYSAELAKHREAMLRQRWESMQATEHRATKDNYEQMNI